MPNFFTASISLCLLLVPLLGGCGEKSQLLDLPKYSEMKNITEAPAALQKAAKAIVKISSEAAGGTGSFISAEGLLLTNNHVLGIDDAVCAREGCHIEIRQSYQIGEKLEPYVSVFAEPRHISVESDATIFQLWHDKTRSRKFASPNFLSIRSVTVDELQGSTVHVIGHSAGAIKKWTSGRVYGGRGNWMYSANYTLPGSSGSPYLDDEGRIVGLHHRVSQGNGLVTRRNILYHSIGTAAGELIKLQSVNQSDTFFSVNERHSIEEILAKQEAYLMAQQGTATLAAGVSVKILDALAVKCDEGLAKTNYASPEMLEKALAACDNAAAWLNCRAPEKTYLSCPTGGARDQWRTRFFQSAERAHAVNSHQIYGRVLNGSKLEESAEASTEISKRLLTSFVSRANPRLDFNLAYQLLNIQGIGVTYRGQKVRDYVTNYRNAPSYAYDFDSVIDAYELFYDEGALTKVQFADAVKAFFADDGLSVIDKLYLETRAYERELF